jgi:hypothetical protein
MPPHSSVATSANAVRPVDALDLARRREAQAQRRKRFAQPLRAVAAIAALALLVLCAVAAAWLHWRNAASELPRLLNAHPFAASFAGAVAAFVILQRHRRGAERRHAASWLATAPIGPREVVAHLRKRALATAAPLGAAVIAGIALLGSASVVGVRDSSALLGAGLLVGALAGWRNGARAPPPAAPTLPRLRDRLRTQDSTAGFDALRRWPFAQLLAAVDPRQHARTVAVVLLSLPMGIPLRTVVPILLLLATGLFAVALLQALLATIPRAADSLRSTPLQLPQLAALLCTRVLARQSAAAVVAATLCRLLGASGTAALAVAAAWLVWIAIAALGAFAARHRPARLRGELVALAIAVSALAVIAPAALLLALPTIGMWQWRRAAQA